MGLTTTTSALKAIIRVFFHHIFRLRTWLRFRKALDWALRLSVLSSKSSIRSPLFKISPTFLIMISLTLASSERARLICWLEEEACWG